MIITITSGGKQGYVLVPTFFTIFIGGKQGFVLVPTFFTIFIARVLEIIDLPPCIKTSYGMDTKLFNLACLKSKTKTVLSILELQYADDNSEAALK